MGWNHQPDMFVFVILLLSFFFPIKQPKKWLYTLPETNRKFAPVNRPKCPKRKRVCQASIFRCYVNLREGKPCWSNRWFSGPGLRSPPNPGTLGDNAVERKLPFRSFFFVLGNPQEVGVECKLVNNYVIMHVFHLPLQFHITDASPWSSFHFAVHVLLFSPVKNGASAWLPLHSSTSW